MYIFLCYHPKNYLLGYNKGTIITSIYINNWCRLKSTLNKKHKIYLLFKQINT